MTTIRRELVDTGILPHRLGVFSLFGSPSLTEEVMHYHVHNLITTRKVKRLLCIYNDHIGKYAHEYCKQHHVKLQFATVRLLEKRCSSRPIDYRLRLITARLNWQVEECYCVVSDKDLISPASIAIDGLTHMATLLKLSIHKEP
jgi:hypothetical protein